MVRKLSCILVGVLLVMMVLPLVPVSWAAADTTCNGGFASPLRPGTYGNVIVPAGTVSPAGVVTPTNCVIYGTMSGGIVLINGNITVEQYGELHLFGGVIVAGGVQSMGAAHIVIQNSKSDTSSLATNVIKGNVQVTNTMYCSTPPPKGSTTPGSCEPHTVLTSATVGGNVQLQGDVGTVTLMSNSIGGNLQLNNSGIPSPYSAGGVSIASNTIDGNAQVDASQGGTSVNTNVILRNLQCI